MKHVQGSTSLRLTRTSVIGGATALAVAMLMLPPHKAEANQLFAAETGKSCRTCHTAPPALNSRGKKFKAKGNKF